MERKKFLNAFQSQIFPNRKQEKKLTSVLDKVFNQKQLKISIPKQMLQRLPIAIAQIKAGNISENLLNEMHKIIYSLYWEKEVSKKIYKNLMNSINL